MIFIRFISSFDRRWRYYIRDVLYIGIDAHAHFVIKWNVYNGYTINIKWIQGSRWITVDNAKYTYVKGTKVYGTRCRVVSCRVKAYTMYTVQCTHAREHGHATFDTCIRFQHQDRLLFTRSKDEHSRKLTELYKMKRNKLPFAHAIFTNLIFFNACSLFFFQQAGRFVDSGFISVLKYFSSWNTFHSENEI